MSTNVQGTPSRVLGVARKKLKLTHIVAMGNNNHNNILKTVDKNGEGLHQQRQKCSVSTTASILKGTGESPGRSMRLRSSPKVQFTTPLAVVREIPMAPVYPKLIGRKEPISQLAHFLGCKPAVNAVKVMKNLQKLNVVTVGQVAEMGDRAMSRIDGLKDCERPGRTMKNVLRLFHAHLIAREGGETFRKKMEMSRRWEVPKVSPGMAWSGTITVTRRSKEAGNGDTDDDADGHEEEGKQEENSCFKEEDGNDGKQGDEGVCKEQECSMVKDVNESIDEGDNVRETEGDIVSKEKEDGDKADDKNHKDESQADKKDKDDDETGKVKVKDKAQDNVIVRDEVVNVRPVQKKREESKKPEIEMKPVSSGGGGGEKLEVEVYVEKGDNDIIDMADRVPENTAAAIPIKNVETRENNNDGRAQNIAKLMFNPLHETLDRIEKEFVGNVAAMTSMEKVGVMKEMSKAQKKMIKLQGLVFEDNTK